jgi:hypothetical protein
MEIPKTLIIGLNLHGEIPLDKESNPIVKTLDNNFIIQFDLVSPGVPNVSTIDNYSMLSEEVGKIVDNFDIDWNTRRNKTKLIELCKQIKENLIKNNEKNRKDITKFNRTIKNQKLSSFIHSYESGFSISAFKEGDNIFNKQFHKFTKQETKTLKINKKNKYFFNKIFIYNIDGKPDVFELFSLLGHDVESINLFELIDFFKNIGAENIVFIDFSCSVFQTEEDSTLTDRLIRVTRRNIRKTYKNKL